MTVRASGWVIMNIEYGHLDHRLDTLRDTIFEGRSLGAPFTIYNMKQICESHSDWHRERECRYIHHWWGWHHWHHHGHHHGHNHHGNHGHHTWHWHSHWKGFHDTNMLLKNVTLHGTLVTQDERVRLEIEKSRVYGQVISAGRKLYVEDTQFHCNLFPANTPCPQ
eukprot:TRINITY_DN60_c0_g1_i3.p2 TRINITY_DN60_c0_g1~~TRINITY_DN60_c0_g1_i3.p2  ORF type:complete len:165 (+),score=52.66 TRINITY_DN60_c0_g1_i3:1-495(+)